MDFFEDVITKARDVLDSAYDTTEKVVTVQKQKMELSSMKKALSKRYEAFGRAVITEVEEGEEIPEKAWSLIEDIRSREEAYAEAKDKLDMASGKNFCSVCNTANSQKAHYCSNCGAEL